MYKMKDFEVQIGIKMRERQNVKKLTAAAAMYIGEKFIRIPFV